MRKESVALLTIILSLVCIGTFCVYSALAVEANREVLFRNHCIFLGVGLFLMMVASKVDYHILKKPFVFRLIVLISLLTLILVLIPGIGLNLNGAQRWIKIGSFTFQPSVFAKFALILLLSVKLAGNQEKITTFKEGFLPPLFILGLFVGLVLLEDDLGTPVVMVFAAYVLFFASGIRWYYLGFSMVPSIAAFVLLIWTVPYRRSRITAYLEPWENADDSAYQLIQSITAFVNGGIWGVGAGAGEQKLHYLPESDTDFILTVLGEEMGLVGTLFLVMIFVALLYYGIRIATHARDLFGTLLGSGIIGMVTFQAAFNMSVAIGLLPTKGLPLPFITRGGTSLMVLLTMMGIVINIGLQAEPKKRKL
jgi:cell division protein FtsW